MNNWHGYEPSNHWQNEGRKQRRANMNTQVFKSGDPVRYKGPSKSFPVDSRLAQTYLDRETVYIVSRVEGALAPYVQLKLIGIPAPLISVLFERAG